MSEATQKVRDFLTKSPSVVYPDDVLGLFEQVERENTELRELIKKAYACIESLCSIVENSPGCSMCPTNQDEDKACGSAVIYDRMRELGVEVGA